MKTIRTFDEMVRRVKARDERRRVAVVCPHDSHTEEVVVRALTEKLADFVLVTDNPDDASVRSINTLFPERTAIVTATDVDDAALKAVMLVGEGRADVLMKGRLNTDNFLRAVLNKEHGLLERGRVLCHITFTENRKGGKLLAFSDAAVIPRPTLEQYDAMVGYCVDTCRRMGVAVPKVALVHCTEKVSDKFPHTLSYEELKKRAAEGRYGDVCIDGPMDVKTACDQESGIIKGIASPVVGNADVLIFPNIETGNVFYKTMTFFAETEIAAMLCGTDVPVVVTSRADSAQSKYNSLALACYVGGKE